MKTRAQLRGKKLDIDCRTAHTTTHEFGISDDRVFCYGLYDPKNCINCAAYVENATPLCTETELADKAKEKEDER